MRKTLSTPAISIVALFSMIAFTGCQTQQVAVDEKVRPYPFDHAIIQYRLTGNIEGVSTSTIKGDNIAHETVATLSTTDENGETITEEINTLVLELENEIYTIDLNTKTGGKTVNPIYEQLKDMTQEQKVEYLTRLVSSAPNSANPKPVRQDSVLGYECDVFESPEVNGEVCVWNTIPLSSSVQIPVTNTYNNMEAVAIDLDTEVSDEAFTVPSDVTLQ